MLNPSSMGSVCCVLLSLDSQVDMTNYMSEQVSTLLLEKKHAANNANVEPPLLLFMVVPISLACSLSFISALHCVGI